MTVKFDAARLGRDVRKQRGERSLREVAPEIGVGFATISRIESGNYPDMVNFSLLVAWLGANPADYFIVDEQDQNPLSAQLRAIKAMSAETASAFMDLIRAVYEQVLDEANEG